MIFYSVYADGDGEVMNRAYDFSSHPCDMGLMKGDKREKKAQQIHWASLVAFIGPCNHSTKRLQIHWAKLSYHPSIHPLIDRATKRASKYLRYIIITLISWSHIRSSKHISSSFHWRVHPLFACSNTLRLKYGNDLFQRHVNMSNRRPTTRVYVHVLQKIITPVWTRSQLIGIRDKPYSLLWCCSNHGSGCLGAVPWKIIGWCQKRSTHKHSFWRV